jgi:hypothetical protein
MQPIRHMNQQYVLIVKKNIAVLVSTMKIWKLIREKELCAWILWMRWVFIWFIVVVSFSQKSLGETNQKDTVCSARWRVWGGWLHSSASQLAPFGSYSTEVDSQALLGISYSRVRWLRWDLHWLNGKMWQHCTELLRTEMFCTTAKL